MSPETHLRASLWALVAFLGLGLWLEALFGLRAEGFVDDALRREFLRLGHAHGGLLALLNLIVGWAMERLETPPRFARAVRPALLTGGLLVGGGFVGGGLWHGTSDPGPLVLLVPAGALMTLAGLTTVAFVRRSDT